MGTQNTASVILQGGQLVGDANRSLQSSVTSGFALLQSSIKDSASIYNGMIASLNDVKRTAIDEWYKQESLKLQGRQLDIEKDSKEGELAYKNNYLKTVQEREKKEASKAPLVGALKAKIDNAQNEEKQLLAEKIRLESIRDGYHFDKDGNRVTFSAGLQAGTPEFDQNKTSLDTITSRLNELRSQTNSYNDGVLRVTLGEDPNNIMTELFGGDSGKTDTNLLPRDDQKFQPGDNAINPLLPNIEPDKPLTSPSPITPPNTPQKKKEEKPDPAATFIKPPETPSGPKPAKPAAGYSLNEYYSLINRVSSEASRDKREPNTDIIQQAFQRLSKEDQYKVEQSGNNILKEFYIKAGEIIARGYESGKDDFNELDAVKKLSSTYKQLLIQRGVNPDKLTQLEISLHDDIIAYRQSDQFGKIQPDESGNNNTRTKATIDFLIQKAESYFNPPVGPPEPSEADKLKAKHQIDSSQFNPDGTLKIDPDLDSDKISKEKEMKPRFDALVKDFQKYTNNNKDTSGFAVNKDYLMWLNKLTPEDLGVPVNNYKQTPSINYGGPKATPRPKDQIKSEMARKIQMLMSNQDLAFYFWLDKFKKVSPDSLPKENRDKYLTFKANNFSFYE